jgi:hypothetical protein
VEKDLGVKDKKNCVTNARREEYWFAAKAVQLLYINYA